MCQKAPELSKAELYTLRIMSVFILVNNASTVGDYTPIKLFTNFEEASKFLLAYEQKTVFKPIILYEYVLENGSATYPVCFFRVIRNKTYVVEGIEKIPVNPTEFRKNHPFLFDKTQSMFADSSEERRGY